MKIGTKVDRKATNMRRLAVVLSPFQAGKPNTYPSRRSPTPQGG